MASCHLAGSGAGHRLIFLEEFGGNNHRVARRFITLFKNGSVDEKGFEKFSPADLEGD
jgi:hypothetical protein